jgi:hypothetical protein
MKRIAVAIALSVMVFGAPLAHADENQLLADAHASNIHVPDGDLELVGMGQMVCNEFEQGQSVDVVAQDLLAKGDIKPFQTGEFIAIAAHDLCPDYYDEVQRWAASQ